MSSIVLMKDSAKVNLMPGAPTNFVRHFLECIISDTEINNLKK